MKNVVGTPARGESFFPREREVAKVISRLEEGNNLQIAAPRRVGKTSILFHLLDQQVNSYIYVYVDSESIDNEQDFYKKILKEIVQLETAESGRLMKLLRKGSNFLRKVKSVKVLETEISFNDNTPDVDYFEELTNLLCGFELNKGQKLILLLDEFPQTILNIVKAHEDDTKAATKFLQTNRELRQNPEIQQKVQFIYTGSIGLNHTVASINASAFVNDLNAVEVEPLSRAEAVELIESLLAGKKIAISPEAVELLLEKIEWYIPFHIQLAVQEITDLARIAGKADIGTVGTAFNRLVDQRNNSHFEHYYSRLRSQFKGDAFKYADELLKKLAEGGTITKAAAADLSFAHNQQDNYRRILEALAYDGYINNSGNPSVFRFNSPIVRMWWQKFIC